MSDAPFVKDGQLPGFYDQAFEAFNAERVLLYVQGALSDFPGLAQNSKFDAVRSATIQNMVLQIKSWCVSGRIPDLVSTHKVEYPDGVWQMFKDRHMPYWFVKRFPVRMKTVEVKETVNHYFVCPHLVTDPQNAHIQFMATGTRLAGRIYR
jgi:hypothetical protein